MISKLADIHAETTIGSNVTIDAFAVIQKGVVIGDGSHIMSHAIIMDNSTLGKGCKVFPGAVIGATPQDLKYEGEKTTVEIGDNTTVRECATINKGTKDKWKTVVGSNCLLMAYSHIAHDCIIGNNVILANSVQLAGHVTVGDYAILGGLAAAIQFTRIGAHTYISGHTEIRKDVPPFIRAGRNPLSYVGVNSVGLQRRGYTSEKINNILDIYRHMYSKGMNISQAIDQVENLFPESQEMIDIVSFIRDSKKGILRFSGKNGTDED